MIEDLQNDSFSWPTDLADSSSFFIFIISLQPFQIVILWLLTFSKMIYIKDTNFIPDLAFQK